MTEQLSTRWSITQTVLSSTVQTHSMLVLDALKHTGMLVFNMENINVCRLLISFVQRFMPYNDIQAVNHQNDHVKHISTNFVKAVIIIIFLFYFFIFFFFFKLLLLFTSPEDKNDGRN